MSAAQARPTSRRLLAATVVIATSVAVVTVAPSALAAPKPKASTITASISPTSTQVGVPTTFAVTISNAATSTNDVGSAQVVVPGSFSSVEVGTATVPGGFVYATPSCSTDSPTGCGAPGTTLVELRTPSSGGAAKVGAGQSLTFYVTATPTAKGSFTWATAAKNSASWSTGQLLTLTGGSPTVTVIGAATHVAFGTAPPATLVAGTTFGTTVRVLDADDELVPSSASVTLSGTGLHGTVSVAAVNGTATFSGLSLWTAGTISVTASSSGLTSASASVVVTPGKPAALVVTGPTGAVGAGTTFPVGVQVNDAYGNAVDPEVVVAISVDGTSRGSQTTTDGSTDFGVVAPTSIGNHTFTVSTTGDFAGSPYSLSVGPTTFSVTAGPATHITIDSVVDTAGLGALSKGAPFNVVVTARDAFENPAVYAGTVTLSTSGGTGSALGTLGGTTSAVLAGGSTATISGAVYSGYGNSITLSATATGLSAGTATINVFAFVTAKNATPGQSLTVDNTGCLDATPGTPVCSSLILPKGANGRVVLGQQICNPFLASCLSSAQDQANLVDALANLTDATGKALYTRNAPATLELRCDKTLCGGAGTNSFPIMFQPTGGAFAQAPACPSKGRIGNDQTFCQDYRSNHRDNAGDLVAYVLFLDDLKSAIK